MKTELEQQGCLADEKLREQGLCLTQGGEPTFVPHDTSRPEWNAAALGDEKLLYARRLARGLAQVLYPGCLVLQSFGKLFPGEPLPRWQLGLYRRRTPKGGPAWQDLQRLRLDQSDPPPATSDHARQLIRRLAATLKLKGTILPAFEDFELFLRGSDDESCQRVIPRFSARSRTFKRTTISPEQWKAWSDKLQPAGWVLPLDFTEEGWITAAWELPTGAEVTLLPGDSPVGLRLPLRQLPESALRCALTVECKHDELIVFLPPLPSLEAFWSLTHAIETVAVRLNLPPVRLEGYPPPRGEDLESITFMSDPGVVEVNLPPADNWPEFQRVVRGLYDAAESCGLRGYKFQMNGRLIGAGGGAHIILGGPDLDRNPFIQRPTLLSSFLRFFQNHPCLSYIFTGLFTGPSSQAPRIDESACELPYELEIALEALEKMCAPGDAFMIDAMLRNLLMDWNGNTHRAEISVDKFYNQDAPNGRLGLIEFRAFEMVPTADMHLAMNLLLRALAAAFAQEPYRNPLIDWKETLHDRFALPFHLAKDLGEVLGYLNGFGFQFQESWFRPQIDFRFPVITSFKLDGLEWTLRQAIEPWPVMGDHTGAGRIVDATTDRLELSATGRGEPIRTVATVNGLRVPLLQETGEATAAGGIRYRLFDNPWGLQPQVRTHCPLAFAWIDPDSGRVVHAFDYHNWKRGGDGYDGPPQSAEEARARVAERLVDRADKRGEQLSWREVPISTPTTLDLRKS